MASSAGGINKRFEPKDRYRVEYCMHNKLFEYQKQNDLESDSSFFKNDLHQLTEQEYLEKRDKKLKSKDGLTINPYKLTENVRQA